MVFVVSHVVSRPTLKEPKEAPFTSTIMSPQEDATNDSQATTPKALPPAADYKYFVTPSCVYSRPIASGH